MIIKFHQGTNTIGGSCIEIRSDSARILLDLGIPLTDEKGNRTESKKAEMPDIAGLFSDADVSVDGIFISHSHLDHYGLLPKINKSIPVYMSQGCKDLISVAHYFEQTEYDPREAIAIPAWEPIKIKDITVTPYLVDHSAFDAFAYLIEYDGKRIFYSGDFRGHGRKSILFDNILKDPPKNIDALICEGTTLSREAKEETLKENDLTDVLGKEFNKYEGLMMVSSSSQNIDRVISIYKACHKSNKEFVISPYTAYILDRIQRKGITIPQYDWENVRVLFVKNRHTKKLADDKFLYKFKKAKIKYEEIDERRNELVVLDSYHVRQRLNAKKMLEGATLIYSQWYGYLKEEDFDFWEKAGANIVKVHSSGHVSPQDLEKFVNALSPNKVIPVHTLSPGTFSELFGSKVIIPTQEEITI